SNNGDDAIMFPSVGVTIPIYRKKYKAMIKEAQYMQESEIAKKGNKKKHVKYNL
ncbi:MAG: TolC family protein, partial [Flavobacteriaceae bacterium]|nr:TolC family protein [Flavobacteriaceae bacterium]